MTVRECLGGVIVLRNCRVDGFTEIDSTAALHMNQCTFGGPVRARWSERERIRRTVEVGLTLGELDEAKTQLRLDAVRFASTTSTSAAWRSGWARSAARSGTTSRTRAIAGEP